MSLNINNPMEFQQQFDNLKEMVNQLASSDEKENSEIREKINNQISLLASATIFPNIFKKSLEEFQKKITSTYTTIERNKLLKDLEKIHKLIIPKSSSSSSSSSVEEESNVSKKATIIELPEAVLLQILEFSFSTKANLALVSSQWKNLIEYPRFWKMTIEEFGMLGIDPSTPPREAFLERIEQDVKVYEELVEQDVKVYEELFPEIPEDLSALEKYRYCKNSERLKKIISEATGLDFDSPNLKNPLSFPHAILDLNSPVSHSILDNLGKYSPEIQKKLVKRVVAKEGDCLGEKDIDRYILSQLWSCGDEFRRKEFRKELEFSLERIPQINEIVQRYNLAIVLINTKREEFKKFYQEEPQPNPVRADFIKFFGGADTFPALPLFKTMLEIFSDGPLDPDAKEKILAEAEKLGLKDTVEFLKGRSVS